MRYINYRIYKLNSECDKNCTFVYKSLQRIISFLISKYFFRGYTRNHKISGNKKGFERISILFLDYNYFMENKTFLI